MTGNTQQQGGTRRSWLRWVGALALGGAMVLGTAAPTAARANPNMPVRYAPTEAPAKAPQGRAALSVKVVKADASGKVDPSLKDLQRQLSFTGFSMVSEHALKLGQGQSDTIPGGGPTYKLKTELVGHDAEKARVRIQIFKGSESRADTTVRLMKDKAFIVKGPKLSDGAIFYLIEYN